MWSLVDNKRVVNYKLRVDLDPSVNEFLKINGAESLQTLKEVVAGGGDRKRSRSPNDNRGSNISKGNHLIKGPKGA